jgi:putative transposase
MPRCDPSFRRYYGPEFISRAVDEWAYREGVKLESSRPGKPTDNAYIESFNGRFRQECLDQHWFETLQEARQTIEKWRREHNESRPHSALCNETPEAFKENWQQARGPNEAEFLALRYSWHKIWVRLKWGHSLIAPLYTNWSHLDTPSLDHYT